jgi:steroid delta-isomerase-like uncharacterized protein
MSTTMTAPADQTVHPTVKAAYDLFNRRDFASLSTYYAANATITAVPTGQTFVGPAGVEQFLRGWIDAFGDAKVEIALLRQSGDTAICEFRGKGTHTGTFRTPMGDVPATGKKIDVPFCDVVTVKDDKIVAIHTYFDTATFAKQLG